MNAEKPEVLEGSFEQGTLLNQWLDTREDSPKLIAHFLNVARTELQRNPALAIEALIVGQEVLLNTNSSAEEIGLAATLLKQTVLSDSSIATQSLVQSLVAVRDRQRLPLQTKVSICSALHSISRQCPRLSVPAPRRTQQDRLNRLIRAVHAAIGPVDGEDVLGFALIVTVILIPFVGVGSLIHHANRQARLQQKLGSRPIQEQITILQDGQARLKCNLPGGGPADQYTPQGPWTSKALGSAIESGRCFVQLML